MENLWKSKCKFDRVVLPSNEINHIIVIILYNSGVS